MSGSHEAFISVVSPEEAIMAGPDYGVEIVKQSGEPRMIQIMGDYDSIMSFMTEYLSMSDSEADIEIGEAGNFDHGEDHFRDAEIELRNARSAGSGRPFESKIMAKSLLESSGWVPSAAEPFPDPPQLAVGDKVDVFLPDSFMTHKAPARVIELVDDVLDATGALPGDVQDEFSGPGFVGDVENEGEMVFSLHQVVPGSKKKYERLMDDDPYMNDANYERHAEYDDGDPKISDYYDTDGGKAAVPFRAWPVKSEGKMMMPKTLVEAMSPTLSPDEVFQAFEELIGSGSEMDAVQAADFISQQNGMDREQVYAILKADEEEMAHQFGGSEAQGQPCDHCGSENTTPNESMPSMMGYGHDDSWKCNDCGKTSFSTPLGESLKTDSFDKFMDKITIQESHNANRKMIVEDSAMRKRAARHQERPAGRTRWSR